MDGLTSAPRPAIYSHSVKNLLKRLTEVNITEDQLPYTVAEGVSVEMYNQLLAQDKHRFRAMLEWTDNKILIIEIPSKAHEAAHGVIGWQIATPVLQPHILPHGAATIASNIGGNSSLEGDQSYCPNNWGPPAGVNMANWVTLVIEITRSAVLAQAQAKALRWIAETPCMEVVLISFSPQGNILRAWVYRQGAPANPIQGPVNFGGVAALGVAQLQISLASVFGGAAHIPPAVAAAHPGVPPALVLDLFPIKQAILHALQ